MSHGPFHIEVAERPGRLFVLHEDLHEVRRIYLDGRDFPEGIEYAGLAMGFSTERVVALGLAQLTWLSLAWIFPETTPLPSV